jgi:hypothetical protein
MSMPFCGGGNDGMKSVKASIATTMPAALQYFTSDTQNVYHIIFLVNKYENNPELLIEDLSIITYFSHYYTTHSLYF